MTDTEYYTARARIAREYSVSQANLGACDAQKAIVRQWANIRKYAQEAK